jgi:hypothetical protein
MRGLRWPVSWSTCWADWMFCIHRRSVTVSTISPERVRLGVQTPRVLREPSGGVRDGHREVLKLCRDTGVELFEWQEQVLALWLRERRDGTPAARACGLNVPRQNGKGCPLEVLGLDSLFGAGVRHGGRALQPARRADRQ